MRVGPTSCPVSRRGVVLLVVLAMLTLFAAVALSFVYYADAEARASRYASQAEVGAIPDVEPELLLAFALNQLLFDVKDDLSGTASALRGHGLMRSLYGADYALKPNGTSE